jgi:hypothetical protein
MLSCKRQDSKLESIKLLHLVGDLFELCDGAFWVTRSKSLCRTVLLNVYVSERTTEIYREKVVCFRLVTVCTASRTKSIELCDHFYRTLIHSFGCVVIYVKNVFVFGSTKLVNFKCFFTQSLMWLSELSCPNSI